MFTVKLTKTVAAISIALSSAFGSTALLAHSSISHHGMYEAGKTDAQNMYFYQQNGKQYLYTIWGVVAIEVNQNGEFKATDSNIPLTGSFYHATDGVYQAGRFNYAGYTSGFGRMKTDGNALSVSKLYDDVWWNSLANSSDCEHTSWLNDSSIEYDNSYIEKLSTLSQDANSPYANTHSFLIAKDGKLVVEKYFAGWNKDFPHTIQSISKSLTSLATGAAIGQGLIGSEQETIAELLPSYQQLLQGDKSQLTLHHFLSMGAGLDWDEWTIPYDNPNNIRSIEMASQDPVTFILDRDVVAQPGTRFQYNGGLVTVLGDILAKQSGKKNLGDYWRSSPMNKLCLEDAYLSMQTGGVSNAAGGAYLRPRDMLRIGQLVAEGGVWHGKSLLPEGWIERSTQIYLPSSDNGVGYGYYWWLSDIEVKGKTYSVTYGLGFGGQVVAIVDELNLVVARTAWHMGGPTPYREMMRDYIIPAFVN